MRLINDSFRCSDKLSHYNENICHFYKTCTTAYDPQEIASNDLGALLRLRYNCSEMVTIVLRFPKQIQTIQSNEGHHLLSKRIAYYRPMAIIYCQNRKLPAVFCISKGFV